MGKNDGKFASKRAAKPVGRSLCGVALSRHNSISLSIKENGDLGLDTSALHSSFPTFVCKNGINHPKIVTFDETIIASPNTFNNNMAAVNAFRSPFAPTRAYLNGIDLYGLENKKLVTVGALRPEFIAYLA